jgi:hypothetical protein
LQLCSSIPAVPVALMGRILAYLALLPIISRYWKWKLSILLIAGTPLAFLQ